MPVYRPSEGGAREGSCHPVLNRHQGRGNLQLFICIITTSAADTGA